jgi:hypothetical protein
MNSSSMKYSNQELTKNNSSSVDYEVRKQFIENLKKLVKSEQEEIFRILKRSNGEYSENSNGIFFDVIKLSPDIFDKMNEFMTFCNKNRINFSIREKEMSDLKPNFD